MGEIGFTSTDVLADEEVPTCCTAAGGTLLELARGCVAFEVELIAFLVEGGGGGRGILGGGGMTRLGLRTFFILAFALGGGTGVLLGVTSAGLVSSFDWLFEDGTERSAAGAGGGGRRRGLV